MNSKQKRQQWASKPLLVHKKITIIIIHFAVVLLIIIVFVRMQPVVLVVRFGEIRALPAPRVGVDTFSQISLLYII